jgi:hypothetical protein
MNKYASLIVVWAVVFLLLISSPMFFAVKHGLSDLLFAESLSRNIFSEGGSFLDWALTPSPAYIPDLVLYFIGYQFLPAAADTIFFVSMCQALLLIGIVAVLIKTLTGTLGIHTILLLFLLMSLFSYTNYTSNIWLYFDSTNNHVGSLLLSLLTLIIHLQVISKGGSRTAYVTLLLLQVTGILNGQMFLVWWIAPSLIALGVMTLLSAFERPGRALCTNLMTLLAIGLSALGISRILKPWVTPWDSLALAGRGNFGIENIPKSVAIFLESIGKILLPIRVDFYLVYSLWLLGIALLAWQFLRILLLGYYQKRSGNPSLLDSLASLISLSIWAEAKRPNKEQQFFIFYCLILIPITFLAIMLSQEFRDPIGLRYFMAPITLPIIFTTLTLSESTHVRRRTHIFTFVLIVFSAITLAYFLANYAAFKPSRLSIVEAREYKNTSERLIADCLDNHKQIFDLKDGVAGFWDAQFITLLSKQALRAAPVSGNNLDARHYMSNINWFLGEAQTPYANPLYNFVITGELDENEVIKNYGAPTRTFKCNHGRTSVLVYDPQQTRFDQKVKAQFKRVVTGLLFSSGKIDNASYTPDMLLLHKGQLKDGFAVSNKDQSGWFIIGPYIKMRAGRYKAKVKYFSKGPQPSKEVGRWEVFTNPDKVFFSGSIKPVNSWTELEFFFTLTPETTDKLMEIRLFTNGTQQITVSQMDIELQ